jgi:hypothetical protein
MKYALAFLLGFTLTIAVQQTVHLLVNGGAW